MEVKGTGARNGWTDRRADRRMDGYINEWNIWVCWTQTTVLKLKGKKIQIFAVGTPLAIQELLLFVLSHCAVFIAL